MRKLFAILAAGALLVSGTAQAVPVATGSASLSVAIQGLAPITLVGPGGLVDVTGTTVTVPAGIVSQVGSLTIAVTATSAVNSLVAVGITNLSGTFSLGGVTGQAAGEVCGAGPANGTACNVGGGIGGVMALGGVINVHVIPNVVVIPVSLTGALIGQGGSTSAPFTINAAAWTTGTGLVNANGVVGGLAGSNSPLTLVTPTFVLALGNLLPIFSIFTMNDVSLVGVVPEPGSMLLIGAGIAGLALLGSRRK